MSGHVCACRVFKCATCWRESKKDKKQKAHDRHVANYDITPGQYQALYLAQGGKCAIRNCRARGITRKLSIDHSHACEASHGGVVRICCVRGLLCSVHNGWLGQAGDDPFVFVSAAEYLWNPPARSAFGRPHPANAEATAPDDLRGSPPSVPDGTD